MDKFDFKKEYKEFYLPPKKPQIITIPRMNFIAVKGQGNPNEKEGEYQAAISLLYGIAFTIKMSYKGTHSIEGFFDYVVPPLEGFWWMKDRTEIDYAHKEEFQWISLIRLPEFVKQTDFDWAVGEAQQKKQTDFSKVTFFTFTEGLCVQCMHIGSYDTEPGTIEAMKEYAASNGCQLDFQMDETNPAACRYHHEIYLSDARKCAPDKLRTVIRHPIKKG